MYLIILHTYTLFTPSHTIFNNTMLCFAHIHSILHFTHISSLFLCFCYYYLFVVCLLFIVSYHKQFVISFFIQVNWVSSALFVVVLGTSEKPTGPSPTCLQAFKSTTRFWLILNTFQTCFWLILNEFEDMFWMCFYR